MDVLTPLKSTPHFTSVLLVLFSWFNLSAQNFDPDRITAWQNAGLTTELYAPEHTLNIVDFGADNTGVNSCNSAFTQAITDLNGTAGTIYFPEGTYFFNAGISLPDSVFIKGASASTLLKFDLGGSGDLIRMSGSISNTILNLEFGAVKGTNVLQLTDVGDIEAGDIIRLSQYDEDLMYSSWAYGSLGQVVQVAEVNGGELVLADPLNHHYPFSRNPYIKKINPRVAAGIECLTIQRLDASTGQTDNIGLNYAFNCVVRNVESIDCNFGHLTIQNSAHILVEGCYFHHAHAYGGGGQGYGVVKQYSTSFCLTQNNSFEHLRHSMLLQAGANGNVYAYNYSLDPYWVSGFLPANSAGDAVLHGNYVFMNLFEGNIVQNIVVDASHGKNGPFNTFFRNRAELYGFFSDASTTTDSMNVVGNEITNTGFLLGMYSVNGTGHYTYGNNVNGTINPSNASVISENSLYLNGAYNPSFLSELDVPLIAYPNAFNQTVIPASERYDTGQPVECSSIVTSTARQNEASDEWLRFTQDGFLIDAAELPTQIKIHDLNGRLLEQLQAPATKVDLKDSYSPAVYLVNAVGRNSVKQMKVLIWR